MPDHTRLPDWPRALRLPLAAAYVGLSATAFREHVASKLSAIHLTPGTVAWLRDDLDRWLDEIAGRTPQSEQVNPWHT